ncbi:hypothetical protein DBR11_07305 [Pedobacter sp. HMWF019]|uniref:ROK family protein n=1 Tax=Pedobacter sp. HMWF019 TaxID=2056856 RepID=UPI000D3CBB65|nr:ROK family protein [Pedobacter sp. HMWF019]PTT01487.1 hypothetical protein DBR11_07305 [Pedobacter sp. HMWF019]
MERIVMGIDIGGSHITAALIDLDQKQIIEGTWVRDRINGQAPTEEVIEAWSKSIHKVADAYSGSYTNLHIAMPGPFAYKKGVSLIKNQDKYRSLYGKNIKDMLAAKLEISSSAINFMNDAACFLQGEVFSGSMNGYDHAIGITLGTGLGTAHYVNGQAKDADFWKMPFNKGIAEDYISTRWFIKRYFELSGVVIKDVRELVDLHAGKPEFKEIFTEFSQNLASFLYKFIRKKMPLASVIGGNIANAEQYFLDDTRRNLAEMMGYSFPVRKSALNEKATLLGAASATF